MKVLFSLLLLCGAVFTTVQGQPADTFTVLQYNLLNYATANNPSSYKNPRLQTIINYCDPDIFGANEIANGSQNAQNILNNVLGGAWEKGSYINSNNSNQTNMLFWKKDKFGLVMQESITSLVRDIIAYKLYYKDPSLALTHDTTFLTVIVAHLKAGSNEDDSTDRAAETNIVAGYLEATAGTPGNYLFMGDLNVYTSAEACYQRLVGSGSALSRFYDPIDRPGDWNSNSSFADIQSQSTRKVSMSDGGVTGGLDDRFDQILISEPVKNNSKRLSYLPASYHIVGQDGLHFNKGLLDNPANSSVPGSVLQALYEMSDHLPVQARFLVQRSGGGNSITARDAGQQMFKVVNPVAGNRLEIGYTGKETLPAGVQVSIYGLSGNRLFHAGWPAGTTAFAAQLPALSRGMYLLRLQDRDGAVLWRGLVIVP